MIGTISDVNKTKIIGLFEARYQAAEEQKLTNKEYSDAMKDMADEVGATPGAMNKAYQDFCLMKNKPEIKEGRDSLMNLVFDA